MDFRGLAKPYPFNRPLTDAERERRLLQKQRQEVDPAYQLSVIRMNSTFMELVDKYFAWKGFLTTVALGFCCMIGGFLLAMALYSLTTPGRMETDWPWLLLMFGMASPVFLLFFWVFKQDNFRFTHYPIRLNRKTRMVHVFRINGTVLSVPWDEVFFCIAPLPQGNWEIQGHVLDKDGVTVKETFCAFPEIAGSRYESEESLKRCWEFIRRYMENGPTSVIEQVKYCLPIADHRESFVFGFHRMHFWIGAAPLLLQIPILLMYLAIYPGRWLAMRTCKIPIWPVEIKRVCPIEANDPYRRDASTNEQL